MPELADWTMRLQQLAAKASQQYGRSMERYQELLELVAAGEIPPAAFREELPRVLREQTPALQRTNELTVAFLAGLVRLNARYRDSFLDALVPSPEASASDELPPFDLTNWFQVLAGYAMEQNGRSMARYQTLVERIASGEITPSGMQDHARRFVERYGAEYVQELTDLGFEFLGRLQDVTYAMSDALYDRLMGRTPAAGTPAPGPPTRLRLQGPSGARVSASLIVENTRREPAEVVCHVSEFAPVGGGRAFRAPLEILPPRLVLGPGQQRELDMHLTLEPSSFEAGREYGATLWIRGHGEQDVQIELRVNVSAPATDGAPVPGAPPPTRTRKTAGGPAASKAGRRRAPRGRRRSTVQR